MEMKVRRSRRVSENIFMCCFVLVFVLMLFVNSTIWMGCFFVIVSSVVVGRTCRLVFVRVQISAYF